MSMQHANFKDKEHLYIIITLFSFKQLLHEVTCSKDESIKFMKQEHILLLSVKRPGPCINGEHTGSCGKPMELKKPTTTEINTCGDVEECIKFKHK